MLLRPGLTLALLVAGLPQSRGLIVSRVSVGPLTRTTSEADLRARFGKENLAPQRFYLGEGYCTDGTVLFPNDPVRRLHIAWTNTKHEAPSLVLITGDGYRTKSGVHVGSTLAELEKLNGKPIVLNSFDMDYSGALTDYQSGKLARELTGITVFTTPAELMADTPVDPLTSDLDVVRAVRPTVANLWVGLNEGTEAEQRAEPKRCP